MMTVFGFLISGLFIGAGLAPVLIIIMVKNELGIVVGIAASSLLLSGSILLAATILKVN